MEFREYFLILRKRWRAVVVVALACLGVAAATTALATPQYMASARLFFSVQGGESVTDLNQGSTFAEQQMASYSEVAETDLVLEPVIEALGLEESPTVLAGALTVRALPETVILEVSAERDSPVEAAAIANAVSGQLAETTAGLSPDRPDGSEVVRVTTLALANEPSSPISPDPIRNLVLGAILGLIVGVGFALLREAMDTKIRSESDVSSLTSAAVIGNVRFDDKTASHPVVMHDDPHGQRAEAYRRLRTNLQFLSLGDRPNSVVITSSVAEEGKSTTALNLAVSIADAGSRVVLVDADLRRPSIADYTGLEGRVGLTTVLIGKAELGDVLQPWGTSTLDILTAGQVPPNPSELLGSRAMSALLKQLTERYDIVVLDTPPLLPVTDAAVLSDKVGGMLIVVGADRIHKTQLRESLESLETVEANVLGLVLNKVSRQESDRYGYSYDSYRPLENRSGGRRSNRGNAKHPRR